MISQSERSTENALNDEAIAKSILNEVYGVAGINLVYVDADSGPLDILIVIGNHADNLVTANSLVSDGKFSGLVGDLRSNAANDLPSCAAGLVIDDLETIVLGTIFLDANHRIPDCLYPLAMRTLGISEAYSPPPSSALSFDEELDRLPQVDKEIIRLHYNIQ